MRFDYLKVLVLGTALAAGGCFANASGDDVESSSSDLRHAQLVGVGNGADNHGAAGSKIPTLVEPNPTETTFGIGEGPSPQPWHGGDQENGDPNGPSPQPWHPMAHLTGAPTDSSGTGNSK